MLALFFEVCPRSDGGWDRYLAIAAGLRAFLAEQKGMLFIDRYRSLSRPGTILSHSLWRDEAALAAGGPMACITTRNQRDGRRSLTTTACASRMWPTRSHQVRMIYRLRCAAPTVIRLLVSCASWSSHRDAANSPAECASPSDAFESLNRDGERLWLFNAADGAEALALACDLRTGGLTARVCEVERDYGMFDRTEAPQYHPPVSRFACPVSGETIGRKAIAS